MSGRYGGEYRAKDVTLWGTFTWENVRKSGVVLGTCFQERSHQEHHRPHQQNHHHHHISFAVIVGVEDRRMIEGSGLRAFLLLLKHHHITSTDLTSFPLPQHHPQVLPYNAPSRASQISRLKSATFDVLIIGGGATGLGTALDASTRGLSTACVEGGDFGGGTSGR